MFGYVKPFQPDLKVCELEVFKSIYCGLCKQIGKSYPNGLRMVLSYDMTFLALVSLSLKEDNVEFEKRRCFVHPLNKRQCLEPCESLSFAADASMILAYHKLKDNLEDYGFFKKSLSLPLLPLFSHVKNKASEKREEFSKIFSNMAREQGEVEKKENATLDMACDPTAKALGEMAVLLMEDNHFDEALYRVGYMLGRYIYIMDAFDDLKQDAKEKSFNPILEKFGETCFEDEEKNKEVIEYTEQILNLSIAQLAGAYELLPIKRYKPILNNIIYLGLHSSKDNLLHKKTCKNKN